MNDTPTAPEKPPMTLWQRIKAGTYGFFSHAIGFIPRGLAMTTMIFAGSAILEGATGFTLMGINTASTEKLLHLMGTHMSIGALFSGVMGAASEIYGPQWHGHSPHAAAPNNPLLSKAEAELGQRIVKGVTDSGIATAATETVFSGSGLPPGVVAGAQKLAQQVGIK